MAAVGEYGAHQLAQLLGFGDGRKVAWGGFGQRTLEVLGDITLGSADSHCIAEHLPGHLLDAVHAVECAPCLHLAQGHQYVPGADSRHGHGANEGDHVFLKPGGDFVLRGACSFCGSLGQPVARHKFKGVSGCVCLGALFFPLGGAGVYPIR
ncbi:MAG: hypothetical protein ACD_23C00556G0002 [uncultured bacterium]|nr:MAG: hypothetical protein ACD_23C00556G0002 [uncultured bacterium]